VDRVGVSRGLGGPKDLAGVPRGLMEEVVVELIEVREELVETAGGLIGAAVELGSKDGLVELRGDRGGLRDSRASSLSEGGRGTVEEEIVALGALTLRCLGLPMMRS